MVEIFKLIFSDVWHLLEFAVLVWMMYALTEHIIHSTIRVIYSCKMAYIKQKMECDRHE